MPSVVIYENGEFGLFDLGTEEVVPVAPGDLMFLASDPAESFVDHKLSVCREGEWRTYQATESAIWSLAQEWGFSSHEINHRLAIADRKSRHRELQEIGTMP